MKCSVCGTENAEQAAFCTNCGSGLRKPVTGETIMLNRQAEASAQGGDSAGARTYSAPPSTGSGFNAPPSFTSTPTAPPNARQGGAAPGQFGTPQPGYVMPQGVMPQTNTLAVVALVMSILNFVALPVIGAIVGVVLGYQARKEIRASNGHQTGDGLATASIVIGWVGLALLIVVIVGFCLLAGLGASFS